MKRGWAILLAWVGTLAGARAATEADPAIAADLAAMRVLDGFQVECFATESEGAVKPIQIRFDPAGRLWMVGSTVYPQIVPGKEPDDRVTVLEDTDGNGRVDRHRVFAGGLMIPTGLEWSQDGVWVGAGGELWKLRDTDGDGVADDRRVVLRGFGTGDTHQTINSFAWGPSGELLLSQGLHAQSRIETPWGVAELRQAGVWRFWPGTVRLEAFWDGAMGAHNPFGTAFDRWGQPIVFAGNGHGIYHLTPGTVPTRHFLLQSALWSQGRKFAGADIVENLHWPDEHRGEFITGGYLNNSVERFRLHPEGSGYRVERLPPLIESTNTAFRVVDVRFGPDGALYLADWCNPVIGHYQTSFRHPDRDRVRGRIWRVTVKGRELLPRPRLEERSTAELVDTLTSSHRWDRQMARRLLAGRPAADVVAAIRQRWENLWERGTWGLEALGTMAELDRLSLDDVAQAQASVHPGLRAFAARLVGQKLARHPDALDMLERGVTDPHAQVRLEALVALAAVPEPRSATLALRVVRQPMDAGLEYALTQVLEALRPVWEGPFARGELEWETPEERAAFARRAGHPEAARQAVERLRRIREVALDATTLSDLADTVARSGGPAELLALLEPAHFMVGTQYLAEVHGAALRRAARTVSERPGQDLGGAAPAVVRLLTNSPPVVQEGAAAVAGSWRLDQTRPVLTQVATAGDRPSVVRQAALDALGHLPGSDALNVLEELAQRDADPAVRTAAAAALARVDTQKGAPFAAALLAEDLPAPDVRRLMEAWVLQREGPARLAAALRQRAPSPTSAAVALAQLAALGRRDADLAQVLQSAAQTGALTPWWKDLDPAALARTVRASGDSVRGAEVFRRDGLGCAVCHAVDGGPGKAGPDLGALGSAQGIEFIIGAILDPQREVKEGFMAHEFEMADGEVHQGYVRSQTPEAVELFDPARREVLRLPRSRVTGTRQVGSVMPPGLVEGLTEAEFRDLVAYLSRLGRRD